MFELHGEGADTEYEVKPEKAQKQGVGNTAETKLLGPFIPIPAAVWAFHFPAELSHATWLNYGRSATKSQFAKKGST